MNETIRAIHSLPRKLVLLTDLTIMAVCQLMSFESKKVIILDLT